MKQEDKELIKRARQEGAHIESLQSKLNNPFLSTNEALKIKTELDFANVYSIGAAARRGLN